VPALPASARRSGNTLYRRAPMPASGTGWLRYAPSEAYRALVREVSPLVTEPSRDLVAADAVPWLADRFLATRARAQREPVFLHKFTGWPGTGFVRQVFPEARFVNIVRDGRAVVASVLRTPWWRGHRGPSRGLGPVAVRVRRRVGGVVVLVRAPGRAGLETADGRVRGCTGSGLPGQWLDVRFEDVLANPGPCSRRCWT
jgi:hypothetical protein